MQPALFGRVECNWLHRQTECIPSALRGVAFTLSAHPAETVLLKELVERLAPVAGRALDREANLRPGILPPKLGDEEAP